MPGAERLRFTSFAWWIRQPILRCCSVWALLAAARSRDLRAGFARLQRQPILRCCSVWALLAAARSRDLRRSVTSAATWSQYSAAAPYGLSSLSARRKALGQRGQVFTAYNLLIGAVMAAVMLMVILGGLSYVESIKYRISLDRLYQGATNAVNTPNSDIIMVENLTFSKESSFTQDAFSQSMGIPEDCISIESWENSAAFEIEGSTITVKQDIQTNVYFQCWLGDCGDSGIECRVSFGSEIS